MEASDWIAGKRHWNQFWRWTRRISRIPGTAYNEALLLDPELAQETAKAKLPKVKNPPLFKFTKEMHLLTDIGDILYKANAKDPQAASLPRPVTAMDKLKTARRQAALNRTIARFAPHHAHLTPRVDT